MFCLEKAVIVAGDFSRQSVLSKAGSLSVSSGSVTSTLADSCVSRVETSTREMTNLRNCRGCGLGCCETFITYSPSINYKMHRYSRHSGKPMPIQGCDILKLFLKPLTQGNKWMISYQALCKFRICKGMTHIAVLFFLKRSANG